MYLDLVFCVVNSRAQIISAWNGILEEYSLQIPQKSLICGGQNDYAKSVKAKSERVARDQQYLANIGGQEFDVICRCERGRQREHNEEDRHSNNCDCH